MDNNTDIIAQIIGFACVACATIAPVMLGLIAGSLIEQSHLKSLARREAELQGMLVTQVKTFPHAAAGDRPPRLIVTEVVISSDYLKTFFTNTRKIFGGEMRSMTRICDRARREAVLRLLEQARREGYNAVCNVRVMTADIGGTMGSNRALMSPILASCTAYQAAPLQPAAPPAAKSPFA